MNADIEMKSAHSEFLNFLRINSVLQFVIPAQAGIQAGLVFEKDEWVSIIFFSWIPASAGMTAFFSIAT